MFGVVFEMGDDSGSSDVIVTYQRPSDIFLIPLSTGVLSELKIGMSLFLKSAEKPELHSCPIESRMNIFRFGYVWDCKDSNGNVGRGRSPESVF